MSILKKVNKYRKQELEDTFRVLNKPLNKDDLLILKIILFIKISYFLCDINLPSEDVVYLYLKKDIGYLNIIEHFKDCSLIKKFPIPIYSIIEFIENSINDGISEGIWNIWFDR